MDRPYLALVWDFGHLNWGLVGALVFDHQVSDLHFFALEEATVLGEVSDLRYLVLELVFHLLVWGR